MSPFFDELEEQLRSAARVRAARKRGEPARRGRSRLRAGLRAAPLLAAIVVALVVVGGALLLLSRGSTRPPLASTTAPAGGGVGAIIAHTPKRQLVRELSYISAATRETVRSPACKLDQPTGVSVVHGSPSESLTSVLGVLERPRTPADWLNPERLAGTPDVYAGHLRLALSAGGVSYFIIPARYDRSAWLPSDRCYDMQLAAFRAYLPQVTRSLRRPAVMLQTMLIAHDRNLELHAPHDTVCLVSTSGNSSSSACGITAAQIKRGIAPADDQGTFSGVVPDGVASVTLSFTASSGNTARTVTATVTNNVYAVHVPGIPGELPSAPRMAWRSTQGIVLKRISPPSVTAACGQHPVACLAVEGVVSQGSTSSSGRAFRGTTSAASP
jgi:hypothetical protein